MLEFFLGTGAVLSGVGAVCMGIAAIRIADAWRIWASRCDPMNPNFKPPLIARKP
jgi:hypothetical protein